MQNFYEVFYPVHIGRYLDTFISEINFKLSLAYRLLPNFYYYGIFYACDI